MLESHLEPLGESRDAVLDSPPEVTSFDAIWREKSRCDVSALSSCILLNLQARMM